jgi:hypothetical protein
MKHEARIASLQAQSIGYESELETSAWRMLSLAAEPVPAKKPRTVWTDQDVKRLVYARTEHNQKFIQNGLLPYK